MKLNNVILSDPALTGERRVSRDSSLRRASSASFRMTLLFFLTMVIPSCTSPEFKNKICFKQHCLDVEVVTTEADRMRGLQFRKSMEENHGKLFVFSQEGEYAFWMKDTYIPLDLIWLDYSKKVVHVEENVQPCRVAPCPTFRPSANALYTLEVNAGYVKKIGLNVGDVAEFQLKNL